MRACRHQARVRGRRLGRSSAPREARRLGLDARERALATRLAYGAVQRRATLDHVIERSPARPVARLEPLVRAALRLGLYQLAYLDRVPAHAAVAESVELVKPARHGGAGSSTPCCAAARARRRRRRGAPATARRGGRAAPLASRVDRGALVRRRSARRRARADGRRQRAGRGGAARQHAARRRRRAGRALPGASHARARACPRASSSTGRSTRSPRRCGTRARSCRSRARRWRSRGCSTRSPASACSTCAPRPAARPPTSPR